MIRGGFFEHYRRSGAVLNRLLDGFIILVILFSLTWYFGVYCDYYFDIGIVSFLLTLIIFQWTQLYHPRRGASFFSLAQQALLSWTLVLVSLSFFGYLMKTSSLFSRKVIVIWAVATPFAMILMRLLINQYLSWLRSRGHNIRNAIIGGAGHLGLKVADNIMDPWLGMRLLGFFDDIKKGDKFWRHESSGRYFPILGNLDKIEEFIHNNNVSIVYLALPLRAEKRIKQVVDYLRNTTASVYLVPDVFAFYLLQASLSDLRGIPIISLWETPFIGVNGLLKRVIDIILASLFIPALLPIMVFCAVGVKLSSPGPIIFKQRRYGLDGKEIVVYKFRTMTVCLDGHDVPLSVRNDNRVAPFGAFLRRHSLDELPQFFNVLMGTMSVVGPRPHAVAHNEFYRSRISGYMLRHKVRPGLTGWAQINGYRGEAEDIEMMKKRVEFDLDYFTKWSLWLDLKIILYTVLLVFKDNKAL